MITGFSVETDTTWVDAMPLRNWITGRCVASWVVVLVIASRQWKGWTYARVALMMPQAPMKQLNAV